MERKGNIKRGWRIVFGALIGAAIPFGLGVYENGTPLAWHMNTWVVIGGLTGFISILCGIGFSGINEVAPLPENAPSIDWRNYDSDRADMDMMIGEYEYMREAHKSGNRAFD